MVRKDANVDIDSHHRSTVATIYSDDHGEVWSIGEEIPKGSVIDSNESSIVRLSDGSFLMNIRNKIDYGHEYSKKDDGTIDQEELNEWNSKKYRAVSRSNDRVSQWNMMEYDYNIEDPVCFGSMCRFDQNKILFVNCSSQKERKNLKIRISDDEGKTWSKGGILSEKVGYADLAVDHNKNVYCIAEKQGTVNDETFYSSILYKFNFGWVKKW